MLAIDRKKKPNTYRGYWGKGKELQCIVSVYHVFLNVSQHNLEQKHHGARAGAATALRCSTQQQHSQSQSQRSAGLVSSPAMDIPPWHPAFMSSLSTKMKTRVGWHFFSHLKTKHTRFTHSTGGRYLWPFLSLPVNKEVTQHQKEGEAFWTSVYTFSFRENKLR